MEWVFMKMKIISWGLTDLPAIQHQILDDLCQYILATTVLYREQIHEKVGLIFLDKSRDGAPLGQVAT